MTEFTGDIIGLLKLLTFSVILAFTIAKLEINIEGIHGWGKNLPTWRVRNRFTEIFFGDQPLTGYHIWFFISGLTVLHFPYFIGLDFSVVTEMRIWAAFFLGMVFEDIWWFILNPAFGIRKLNKFDAHWHKHWLGFVLRFYFYYSVFGITLLLLSFKFVNYE